MFDIPDITITPNTEYYIILRSSDERWGAIWMTGNKDPYINGGFYQSNNQGETWRERTSLDGCFVTFG
jgi:hypothetical protein